MKFPFNYNFTVDLVRDRPELPQRRGVTLAPKNGVKMIFQSKRTVEHQQQLTEVG